MLQGGNDEYGTESQVRAIAEGVGERASTRLFPGVGHVPHREVTEEVIRAVSEFAAMVASTWARPGSR